MSRYFAGKVVPIITTFISGQRKIQENYFPEVFNIGFLLICGPGDRLASISVVDLSICQNSDSPALDWTV
jgi:hypothetical protein